MSIRFWVVTMCLALYQCGISLLCLTGCHRHGAERTEARCAACSIFTCVSAPITTTRITIEHVQQVRISFMSPPHPHISLPYLPHQATILSSVAIDFFCPLNLMQRESGILCLGIWLLLLDSMSEIYPHPSVFQCLRSVGFNSYIVFYYMNGPLFIYLLYCW